MGLMGVSLVAGLCGDGLSVVVLCIGVLSLCAWGLAGFVAYDLCAVGSVAVDS